jgi:hypothetical protein
MERAFRFLKRTSVSCKALGEGAGVTDEESGGVLLAGDAIGEAPVMSERLAGVSSCAGRIEIAKTETSEAQKINDRTFIGSRV